jgi:hypothetical protein
MTTPWSATGDAPMKKAMIPLALTFAAGLALACPADGPPMDAKTDSSPSVTAATTSPTPQQAKAVVDTKKAVKPAEDNKLTAQVKKPTS